jgi:hypothetical protein
MGQPETIIYDIATNTWMNTGLLSGSTFGHAYDSNAIDPSARELYAPLHWPISKIVFHVINTVSISRARVRFSLSYSTTRRGCLTSGCGGIVG